jgi:hypothetical protein
VAGRLSVLLPGKKSQLVGGANILRENQQLTLLLLRERTVLPPLLSLLASNRRSSPFDGDDAPSSSGHVTSKGLKSPVEKFTNRGVKFGSLGLVFDWLIWKMM